MTAQRATMASIVIGFSLTISGCAQGSMPAEISKLQLSPGAVITAASLGLDRRVWFAYSNNGPGPGVGYIDDNGDVQLTQIDPVADGHAIGDLAVDASHGIWATLPCYPYGSRCVSGLARFGGDFGPLTKIDALGKTDTMPLGLSLNDDGSAWIAERNANAILHVTPDGRRSVIGLSDPKFKPVGAEPDYDGGAYFDGPEPGKILAVNRQGHIRWFVLPSRNSHTSSAKRDLAGNIWVSEYDAGKIVSIDPRGRMTEYAVPTPNAGPGAIAIDRRGVWFVEYDGEKLGRIDPNGTVKDAYLPVDVGRPDYLVAGPNDTLVVIGNTKGIFGISQSWTIARIREATAIL